MEEVKKDTNSKIKSIDKACKIIDIIANHKNGMRLKDISKSMGLSLSSIHHTIGTLIANKLLFKNPDNGKYYLGFKVGELGNRYYANLPFYDNLIPYLEKLREEFNETVNLMVIQNSDFVIGESFSSTHSLQPIISLNKKQIHATAWGKILLSSLSDEALDEFFKKYDFIKFTKNTIDNIVDMKREIENIRENNISFDNEELENGLCCLGIPIYGSRHRLIAAITISTPKNRFSNDVKEKITKTMLMILQETQNKFGKKKHN
jgi:DNA-binding IclR family transcriptional regulator